MKEPGILTSMGKRIKELRKKKNLTQNALAMECEFEKASMSRIESGHTNPTIKTLYKIAKALDVHITELFKD